MLRHLPRREPGLYHLGLRVESTDAELIRLRGSGMRALDGGPREGDEPAACGGVLVELVQRLK